MLLYRHLQQTSTCGCIQGPPLGRAASGGNSPASTGTTASEEGLFGTQQSSAALDGPLNQQQKLPAVDSLQDMCNMLLPLARAPSSPGAMSMGPDVPELALWGNPQV